MIGTQTHQFVSPALWALCQDQLSGGQSLPGTGPVAPRERDGALLDLAPFHSFVNPVLVLDMIPNTPLTSRSTQVGSGDNAGSVDGTWSSWALAMLPQLTLPSSCPTWLWNVRQHRQLFVLQHLCPTRTADRSLLDGCDVASVIYTSFGTSLSTEDNLGGSPPTLTPRAFLELGSRLWTATPLKTPPNTYVSCQLRRQVNTSWMISTSHLSDCRHRPWLNTKALRNSQFLSDNHPEPTVAWGT